MADEGKVVVNAYQAALELEPPNAVRRFIAKRIRELQEGGRGRGGG